MVNPNASGSSSQEICRICNEVGDESKLIKCSECYGREHTYCSVLCFLREVPLMWTCGECCNLPPGARNQPRTQVPAPNTVNLPSQVLQVPPGVRNQPITQVPARGTVNHTSQVLQVLTGARNQPRTQLPAPDTANDSSRVLQVPTGARNQPRTQVAARYTANDSSRVLQVPTGARIRSTSPVPALDLSWGMGIWPDTRKDRYQPITQVAARDTVNDSSRVLGDQYPTGPRIRSTSPVPAWDSFCGLQVPPGSRIRSTTPWDTARNQPRTQVPDRDTARNQPRTRVPDRDTARNQPRTQIPDRDTARNQPRTQVAPRDTARNQQRTQVPARDTTNDSSWGLHIQPGDRNRSRSPVHARNIARAVPIQPSGRRSSVAARDNANRAEEEDTSSSESSDANKGKGNNA